MKKPARAIAGPPDDTRLHYEGPAVDTRRSLLSAAVVAATVILAGVVSHEIYSALVRPANERSSTPLYGEGLVLPAAPRLEGIEMMSATGAATSAGEDRLQKYGWIDREKKIVHIPIQKAMELTIEQDWLRSTTRPLDDGPKHTDNSTSANESHSAR